jgi:peptidoglycan/LPS O-acetylase OafA/YrhL
VTEATAAIEFLVGAACLAMAWPCWRRGGWTFRAVAGVLAVAGLVAILNAVASIA